MNRMKAPLVRCRHCHKEYIWNEKQIYCSVSCSSERGKYRRAELGKSTIEALLLLEGRGEDGLLEENYHLKQFSRKARPLTSVKMEQCGHIYVSRFHLTRFGKALIRYWRAKGLINAKAD
jgi:hypothetical protein